MLGERVSEWKRNGRKMTRKIFALCFYCFCFFQSSVRKYTLHRLTHEYVLCSYIYAHRATTNGRNNKNRKKNQMFALLLFHSHMVFTTFSLRLLLFLFTQMQKEIVYVFSFFWIKILILSICHQKKKKSHILI